MTTNPTSPRRTHRARLLLTAAFCLGPSWVAATAATDGEPVLEHGRIACPDGVFLEHSVVRPDRADPVPALLIRTPYGRALNLPSARALAQKGVAVLVQDCRGTGTSKEEFLPFVNETEDGRAAFDWLHAQPWCNGQVGTTGMSYLGITQWRLVADPDVALSAMLLQFSSSDLYRSLVHYGGSQALAIGLSWSLMTAGQFGAPKFGHLPVIEKDDASGKDVTAWNDWSQHESLDGYWKRLDFADRRSDIKSPALLVAGWYDLFLPGQVSDYVALASREGPPEESFSRIIIGPWDHGGPSRSQGRPDLGPEAYVATTGEEQQFLQRFLLGEDNGYEQKAGVRAFFLGENAWHELDAWPPSEARAQSFYLHGLGHAADANGDGVLTRNPPNRKEPADAYVYDPSDPTPSFASDLWGPLSNLRDQAEIGARPDVLQYTTLPLREPLRIAGPMSCTLSFETDMADTDVAAKLVSIAPDGTSDWRGEGILRARYREGIDEARFMTPGEVVELRVEMGPMACTIPAGHRLGLQIASANYPRFTRNLGGAEPTATATEMRVATNKVHHSLGAASRLDLDVIPAAQQGD